MAPRFDILSVGALVLLAQGFAIIDVGTVMRSSTGYSESQSRAIRLARRSRIVDVLPYMAISLATIGMIHHPGSEIQIMCISALAVVPLRLAFACWAPNAIPHLSAPSPVALPRGLEVVVRKEATGEMWSHRILVPLVVILAGAIPLVPLTPAILTSGHMAVVAVLIIPVAVLTIAQALSTAAALTGQIVRFETLDPIAVYSTFRAFRAARTTVTAAYAALAAVVMVDRLGVVVCACTSVVGICVYTSTVRLWMVLRISLGDLRFYEMRLRPADAPCTEASDPAGSLDARTSPSDPPRTW